MRSELLKEARQRQNLCSHIFVQLVELRLKLIANLYDPTQLLIIMAYKTYVVNYICSRPAWRRFLMFVVVFVIYNDISKILPPG